MNIVLLCEDKAVPANWQALRDLSPSLGALVHFRQHQIEEENGVSILLSPDNPFPVPIVSLSYAQCRTIVHFSTSGELFLDDIFVNPADVTAEVEHLVSLLPAVEEHMMVSTLGIAIQKRLLQCLYFHTAQLLLLVSLRFPITLHCLLPCAAKTVLVMLCTQGPEVFAEQDEGQEEVDGGEGWRELCGEALICLTQSS